MIHPKDDHANVPHYMESKVQPPLSDLVPDAYWTTLPLYERINRATWADVRGILAFLMVGPLSALAAQCLMQVVLVSLTFIEYVVEHSSSAWMLLITTPTFMISVWLVLSVFLGSEASGIPRVLVAYRLVGQAATRQPRNTWDDLWNGGVFEHFLSLRIAVGKWLLHALIAIGGASAGPEGPAIQIGASIGSSLCKLTHTSFFYQRGAIVAGAASAVSALFNAPLGAIVFVIEEVAGEYEHFSMRVLTVLSVALGRAAVWGMPTANDVFLGTRGRPAELTDYFAAPIIGILLGLLGGFFARLLSEGAKARRRFPQTHRRFSIAFAGACGVVLVLLNLSVDGALFGPGENISRLFLDAAETGSFPSTVLFYGYGPLKFIATLLSCWSFVPGGAFVPGHSVGIGFGVYLCYLCPWVAKETVLVLSLVAYFSGFTQGPLNTVVIAAEITGMNLSMVPVALLTGGIAAAASKFVCPYPIYQLLARIENQAVPSFDRRTVNATMMGAIDMEDMGESSTAALTAHIESQVVDVDDDREDDRSIDQVVA